MCTTGHSKGGCPRVCGHISHLLAGLLWFLGLISLVGAWVAVYQGSLFGFEVGFWYTNVSSLALLGLLAGLNGLFHAVKKSGCSGSCGDEKGHGGDACGCGGGACGCGEEEEKKS